MLNRKTVLLLLMLIAPTFSYGMDVRHDKKRNEYTTFLTGKIVPGDLAKITVKARGTKTNKGLPLSAG